MKDDWLEKSLEFAEQTASFYSGARKIIRPVRFTFGPPSDDLKIEDCGFTKSKLTLLRKLYLVQESIDVAIQLWERRKAQDKYGSVGFHCYGHHIKNDPDKKSKRASVMGPCIQSVTLTYLPNRTTSVDAFYRTTELFKKFPADLVFLRDMLLSQFDFEKAPISEINFHFANVTCHPMYFVTLLPHMDKPIRELERLKKRDPYFFNWVVKWTARYICDEHHRGIAKFAQALRVQKDAHTRLSAKVRQELAEYLRANHPGHRNQYEEEDDDE